MTVETLKGIRGDEQLYLFCTKVTSKSGAIDVGEHALYRRRKAPMRCDDRLCEGDFTKTAKDLHRQKYIEANDTIVAYIQDQPDQHGHTILRTLESLLMKAFIRRSILTRIRTSFDICITRTSTKNKKTSRPTVAAGRLFRCCDSRWSDEYLSHERVLSVTQPGAAIAKVASDRTTPVQSHHYHSCNE